jgi:hypothetical protein
MKEKRKQKTNCERARERGEREGERGRERVERENEKGRGVQ